MDTGQPAAKEATILSLSEEIGKLLSEFQDKLDNRFNRSIKPEGMCEGKSQADNVLDEIIQNLQDDKFHLSSIMSFISSDVLPKIN